MAPKPRIFFNKSDYEKAHGIGALARGAQGAGAKGATGASGGGKALKQPQPQRGGAAAGGAGAGGRMAPYSTRRQRQQQEEEKEQLAPSGYYEPVRGGKRKKARGGAAAAMDVVPVAASAPMYPVMVPYPPQELYGASAATGGGQGAGKGKASTALATAQAIINSAAPHPKKAEIKQLMQAHLKGWVPPKNFQESLAKLLL